MSTSPASSRPRIALAGCFHETNTFAATPTDEATFRGTRGWFVGSELLDAYQGTRTVMGGMIDAAATHGIELVPIFGAFATPAGTVTRPAFDTITTRVMDGLEQAGQLDALLLELHGAMVVEDDPDPETSLLRDIRATLGHLPIATVTDLHANMTPERVTYLDVLVGYRTNPHVDTYEAGVEAVGHLVHLVRDGRRTTVRHGSVPIVAAPIAQSTAEVPLRRSIETARDLERRDGMFNVTVHGGYAFADVAHAGLSFTVTAPADRGDQADEILTTLRRQAWDHRAEFAVALPDTDAAIRTAVGHLELHGGPVAVTDTGDNINGGGPGDTTWLLRAALDQVDAPIATTLWDPAAVAAAREAGVGGTFPASLGGRAEALGGAPLQGRATVRYVGDGRFVNAGPMSEGAQVTMGPTAVVSFGRANVVLQSVPVQPNDPELFRSVGLDPADHALVLLKGAAAVRAGWEAVVTAFVDAGTPGVTDCDLDRLPYRHLRPVWPLSAHAAPTDLPGTSEGRP